jgi:hypothetical protein
VDDARFFGAALPEDVLDDDAREDEDLALEDEDDFEGEPALDDADFDVDEDDDDFDDDDEDDDDFEDEPAFDDEDDDRFDAPSFADFDDAVRFLRSATVERFGFPPFRLASSAAARSPPSSGLRLVFFGAWPFALRAMRSMTASR